MPSERRTAGDRQPVLRRRPERRGERRRREAPADDLRAVAAGARRRQDSRIRPKDALDRIPAAARRATAPGLPEINEPEVVRHYVNLSQLNYAIDTGFYPLGSCTMKFNPKLNEWAARLPGFASLHPLAPDEVAQGTLQLLWELEQILAEISGMRASDAPARGRRPG